MAIANTIIQVKKSGVSGNVPSSLGSGELALNFADHKLFYKNASGGTSYFYGANNGPSFATVSNGTSLIVASTPNDTLTFAAGSGVTVESNSITKTVTISSTGGGGGSSNSFSTILVSGQPNVVANSPTAPLTLVAGSGITLTTDGTSNTITFASTGGFSGGTISDALYIANSTPSTDQYSGALIVDGGVGVGGDLYSSSLYTPIVSTSSSELSLSQTGDEFGTSYLKIQNRSGQNGPLFGTDTIGLVDFGFSANTGTKGSIRYETRTGSTLYTGQPQFGISLNDPDLPELVVSASGIDVTGNINLSGTINLPSGTGDILRDGVSVLGGGGSAFNGGTITNTLNVSNTTSSYTISNNALVVAGSVGVANSVYVGNRVGFGNTTTSFAYQVYNPTYNSIDTIFG